MGWHLRDANTLFLSSVYLNVCILRVEFGPVVVFFKAGKVSPFFRHYVYVLEYILNVDHVRFSQLESLLISCPYQVTLIIAMTLIFQYAPTLTNSIF